MTADEALKNLVRVGTVTDVNNAELKARVRFQDVGVTSDWLHVLRNQPFIPDYDVPQKTELTSGGAGESSYESHSHNLVIKPWMPKVNETVVALYLPIFNGDGFILGGVGK